MQCISCPEIFLHQRKLCWRVRRAAAEANLGEADREQFLSGRW